MNANKSITYADLVQSRKLCRLCSGDIVNPSCYRDGIYDSNQIGPWTRWQGNLNAQLMVIGQDWGDVGSFISQKGLESDKSGSNKTIRELLDYIGIKIPLPSQGSVDANEIFMTNSILCLKETKADPENEWYNNCGKQFLKPLIQLIHPKVVVTLGEKAYILMTNLFTLPKVPFKDAVNVPEGVKLFDDIIYIPVYHTSPQVINITRHLPEQLHDWQRVRTALDKSI